MRRDLFQRVQGSQKCNGDTGTFMRVRKNAVLFTVAQWICMTGDRSMHSAKPWPAKRDPGFVVRCEVALLAPFQAIHFEIEPNILSPYRRACLPLWAFDRSNVRSERETESANSAPISSPSSGSFERPSPSDQTAIRVTMRKGAQKVWASASMAEFPIGTSTTSGLVWSIRLEKLPTPTHERFVVALGTPSEATMPA